MTMPACLDQATQVVAITTSAATSYYTWSVPDGWQQGRGAFGGLVLAAMLRAIVASEADSQRVVRTLTGDLCGPVTPGPAEICVEVLRRGRHLSNVDARLRQGGVVLARASAVLSSPQIVVAGPESASPQVGDWRATPELLLAPPQAPVFAPHFVFRPVGHGPFASATAAPPTTCGWLGLRAALPHLDAPAVIALLDAWWPAIFAGKPRPIATVSFTAEILTDLQALDPAVPCFHVGRVAAVHDGFCVELRELWHGSQLVALNQQTFAILG